MRAKSEVTVGAALERLDAIDPKTAVVRDRSDTALIRAAVEMRDAGERLVDEAVIAARHRGLTWIEIAAGLGVSPQAARKKYLDRV